MPLRYTRGFIDNVTLLLKFDKHVTRRREFTYATAVEYEEHADQFLGAPLGPDVRECVRTKRDGSEGDKLRYNQVSEEFGSLANDNIIRSYFIPDPVRHHKATNLDYFEQACAEIRG